eukprot:Opistho-2@63285
MSAGRRQSYEFAIEAAAIQTLSTIDAPAPVTVPDEEDAAGGRRSFFKRMKSRRGSRMGRSRSRTRVVQADGKHTDAKTSERPSRDLGVGLPRNIIERVFFSWVVPAIRQAGSKGDESITQDDVFALDKYCEAGASADHVEGELREASKAGRSPSLGRVLAFHLNEHGTGWGWFPIALCVGIFRVACLLAQPVILEQILSIIDDKSKDAATGYGLIGILCAVVLVGTMADHQQAWVSQRASVRIRAALFSLIYRKSLRLRASATAGAAMSVMSVDAESIKAFFEILVPLLLGPVELIAILILMYRLLGLAMLVAVAVMFTSVMLSMSMAKRLVAIGKLKAKYTSERVKLVSEIVNGIRAIKFYGWEAQFISRIESVRQMEAKYIRGFSRASIALMGMVLSTPQLLTGAVFIIFSVISSDGLSLSIVFPALIYLNNVRMLIHVFPEHQSKFVARDCRLGSSQSFSFHRRKCHRCLTLRSDCNRTRARTRHHPTRRPPREKQRKRALQSTLSIRRTKLKILRRIFSASTQLIRLRTRRQ